MSRASSDFLAQMERLSASVRRAVAQAALGGGSPGETIAFDQDIEDTFYGSRQFSIRDVFGYALVFIQ